MSVLLDAGVLFLLRWALDDSSDAVLVAALQGLAAILIVPSDKVHVHVLVAGKIRSQVESVFYSR